MAIGKTIRLDSLDRAERIALAAAFQRASWTARVWDQQVEAAIDELVVNALIGNNEVLLTVEEADCAHKRLFLFLKTANYQDAPELLAVAQKVVDLL